MSNLDKIKQLRQSTGAGFKDCGAAIEEANGDLEKAGEIINKYNCIEDTLLRAKHFSSIAKDSLGVFNDNKYKKILLKLIDSSFSRNN